MTADQVGKAMPDDLLSSDTSAIQPATSLEPSVHMDPSHVVDQHGQTTLNTSAIVPVLDLGSPADLRSGHVLDLVSVQASHQIVSMETTSTFSTEVKGAEGNIGGSNLTNVSNALDDIRHFGNGGASLSSIQATGHILPEDKDNAARSQSITVNFHCHADDVLESVKDNKATVEPVVSRDLSKTTSTDSPMIPDQNSDLDVLETNHDVENTQHTLKVSNIKDSIQTQDQPQVRPVKRDSSAVGNIPDTSFEMNWIPETLQGGMTGVDSVDQANTVCNTDRSNVIKNDPEISGVTEETVHNFTLDTSSIVLDTVSYIVSEMDDSAGVCEACEPGSEIGDIVANVTVGSCLSSGEHTHGIDSEISGTVATTDYCNDSEIKEGAGVIVLNTDSDLTIDSTATNQGNPMPTPEMNKVVGETVHNFSFKISGIVQESVCHVDSKVCDSTEDNARKLSPKTGDIDGKVKAYCLSSEDCTHSTNCGIVSTTANYTASKIKDSEEVTVPNTDSDLTVVCCSDSKIKGTETVPNISPEKHTIVWDTVSHTDFDISDSVKDIACKSGPEISEIVGDGSGKTESESTLNPAVRNTAEERWHKTEPERINTTAENISDTNSEVRDIIKVTTCQISSEEAETSQSIDAGVGNIIEESHQETACNPDSESGYFFGEFSICSVDFDADCKTNDTVELALPNSDSETNDTKEGGILNSNSDKCDSQRLTLKSSRTNEVIPMPQNDPKIGEIHGEHLEFETTISSTDGDDIHKVMPERSDTTAGRIYDTDSEDRDIVKETTSHIICKKVETSQQTDSGVSNIIEESHLETVCNNVTEKACIFGESQNDPQIGETTISSSDGENISKVMSKRSDTTAVDSEERGIVEETTNHISCKEVETSQHTDSGESNIIDESHLETVCNSETEKACIFGESSICSGDSEDSVGLTVDNTDSEVNYIGKGLQWKAVPNISLEKSGIVQGSVCHIDPEKLDFAEDTACKLDPEIGDIFGEIKVKTTVSDSPTEISHKTEQERSNTTRKNTHDTESEVILEPQKKFAIEMNQPLKVIDSQILRHPSTQPSVVESHDNNVEEGGTIASILDPGMPNQKGMPADSLTDLTFNLLANVMTPPQNLAEESDLDMLSSKSCELEYLVPHSIPLLQLESKAFHSNDPTVDNLSENSPDIHLQIPSFPHTSIGKPQISEETETDPPPQDDTLHLGHPHVALQDLESSYKWVEGEGSGSEVTDARCSKQLWTDADARPFLAFEENQGSIFDEWGHSPAPSPPRASPDNTKPLAYSHERDTVIGQMVDDWELPPIERWSSSDSWASALSDWFQSVDVYTEDSPLAATTISCSSPVDSLSVPYLSYQDSSEGQKGSPEITSTSGQMCLPLCSGNDNNFNGLEQQLTDTDLNLHNQSYTTGTKDSTGDSAVPKQEMDMELETVKPYGAYRPKHMGSHVQEDTNVPGKFIKDNSKGKAANQQISRTKQDSDAVWGVAENRTSQLFPDFEEENLKNHGPLKFSDYPSNRTPRAGPVCGPCFETHPPPQLGGHVPSELEHLTHAEGAPHCAHSHSCTEGTRSHVSLYTKDSETNQGEGRAGDPLRFIMPFAPIATGTSFCHPKTFISSKPSLIGVTNELRADPTAYSPDKPASGEESSDEQFHTCSEKSCEQTSASSCVESEDSQESTTHKTDLQKARHLGQELSKLILLTGQRFTVSEKKRVAYVTLDLDDPLNFNKDTSLRCDQGVLSCPKHAVNCEEHHLHTKDDSTMPQKAGKTSSEGKARSKHKVDKGDNKMTGPQLGTPSKKQEKVRAEPQVEVENECLGSGDSTVTVIETIVITEKVTPKTQGGQKKKKKPCMAKLESEPLATVENGARPKATNATKAKNQCSEDMPTPKTGKTVKEKPGLPLISMMNMASADGSLKATGINQHKEPEADSKANIAKAGKTPCGQDAQGTCLPKMLEDDVIKRRRLSEVKSEAVPIRTRPQLPAIFRQKKEEDVPFKKAYSDVVKQKIQTPKEAVVVPHVVAEIQAAPVPEDPQSISLWCQFSPVAAESSISWTKEGKILTEMKRGAGDDSRVTLSILKACSKDLGMYRCTLTGSTGTVFSSDYHLTSEVLMELVLPSHDTPVERHRVEGDEESVHCAPLLFRNDILTEQYFGENQSASIVTEKDHFGEGMHRKAFRTTLRTGMEPAFNPGHPCVLKVHNAITYGTKNNEELVQKNYNLAVEECHVQNTAREYIKAYNNAAKSTESFGDVPEIIPIYLVHRPSSDIPYATLEEELIGDFVKYSVKDGKEINLMRRDSEAGQKCCAFQHWVYSQTDGNLLVTDMQGVGMRLTDVGIATCKKGYKGFKGNCATSFIDQFQALHQCNRFCELLGLTSLQPKPKRTVAPPKPKTQPAPKKKTCGPVLKSKS